jgi:hypothetical protein
MIAPKIKNVSELEQQHIERRLRKMPHNEWRKWLIKNKYVLEKPEETVDLHDTSERPE